MILVDSSIWIAHLRTADARLSSLLNNRRVLSHPFVIGEVALGSMRQREIVLSDLSDLPKAEVADDIEVLGFIGRHNLYGRGIGYVDVHLLASARLTPGATIWTLDRRLNAVASCLGLAVKTNGGV